MYAVFAGGGKVGRFIARDLLTHDHDVAIVEPVPGRCDDLLREFDLLVVQGDATDVRDLKQVRPERADVFVATTHDDDANFVACQLALTAFEVPRVIARVNKPENEELFQRLGIEGVSSTTLISRLIREQLSVGELIHLATLRAGKVNLVEVDIPMDGGKRLRRLDELELPPEAVVVCVFRGEETVLPQPSTRLQPGDQVIALTRPDREEALRAGLLAKQESA
jgi:trk system potassium uptake protein TrkA